MADISDSVEQPSSSKTADIMDARKFFLLIYKDVKRYMYTFINYS